MYRDAPSCQGISGRGDREEEQCGDVRQDVPTSHIFRRYCWQVPLGTGQVPAIELDNGGCIWMLPWVIAPPSSMFGERSVRFALLTVQQANAEEFIVKLPEGYNTLVGERGVSLSGGQRQRLAIARAILRNPPVLILDEATSALDYESERLIQEALDRLCVGRTVITIAHRLSTIRNASRIIVLTDGRIAEEGNFASLTAHGGAFARLVAAQNTGDGFLRP